MAHFHWFVSLGAVLLSSSLSQAQELRLEEAPEELGQSAKLSEQCELLPTWSKRLGSYLGKICISISRDRPFLTPGRGNNSP
jgi:hypothetical protein